MTSTSGPDVHVEDGRLRRGIRTREQILNAAIDLFGSKGFAATSMKDLASAAGVQAPAIYNHFPSKERILAATLIQTLEDFKAHVVDSDDPTRPVAARLENLVHTHVAYQVSHAKVVRSVDNLLETVAAGDLLTTEDQTEIRVYQQAYRALMSGLIDEVRATSRAQVPSTALCVLAILAVCDQSRSWFLDTDGVSVDDVKNGCWSLVAGMLRLD
ncbi:MAG: TetR family transcriptional regulator protein [Aeromicrobium sp.]|nr:TetR family transcriptional regulator protein [Aeromicrobium sp.]